MQGGKKTTELDGIAQAGTPLQNNGSEMETTFLLLSYGIDTFVADINCTDCEAGFYNSTASSTYVDLTPDGTMQSLAFDDYWCSGDIQGT